MKLDGCSVLITGASVGIGREFARQLANRAGSLVLVARRSERLADLSEELIRCNPKLNIHVRVVDLANKLQIERLIEWLSQDKIDIDLLINNAGLGDSGPFATSDPARNQQIMLVNIIALTSLTRRLLPQMIARYAATKAYVTSLSVALRTELRGTGVSVSTLCPGPVHTEFGEVAKRSGGQAEAGPEFIYVPVEQVARDGLAAVETDRPLVIPGFAMKLGMLLVRMTPMSILRRFSSKQR